MLLILALITDLVMPVKLYALSWTYNLESAKIKAKQTD